MLKRWNPNLSWREIEFNSSTIWVQIHGLPFLWQFEENLRNIRAKVGKVVELDFTGDGGGDWRRFTRIRIEVDYNLCSTDAFRDSGAGAGAGLGNF